ncbi:hypothetical protein AVEN_150187-1 [Araneus ventricosus]|uniref:Uncharacterized protein n=1 Tax=Araneus ventricosus TaxID=182803 RepID=A0A4Y2J6N8_ARAVE|nr:hypothetical protein AVEN_150187-1 [Araneus ventricosus]
MTAIHLSDVIWNTYFVWGAMGRIAVSWMTTPVHRANTVDECLQWRISPVWIATYLPDLNNIDVGAMLPTNCARQHPSHRVYRNFEGIA